MLNGFPRNPEARIIWINSLPTKVTVNDDTVLCEKHWSAGFPRKSCQGPLGYRPIIPSEFGSTPASFLPQTPSVVERNVERRNVSTESRALRIKVYAEKCDLIGCWDDLRTYCANINLASDLGNDIKLYHIEGMPPIIYSIFISRDMTVSAYKGILPLLFVM